MSADIDATIAELAVVTPYSRDGLRAAVERLRQGAANRNRELRPEWIPSLLRVLVDLRIAGLPSGQAIIALLPPGKDSAE